MDYQVADNTAASTAAFNVGVPTSDREVIEISDRSSVNMHDEYYHHATADHFWIEWRFAELRRLIGGVHLGQQFLEVGCGNGVMQAMFEKEFGVPVHGCDLNLTALERAVPAEGNLYLYDVMDRCPEWENWFHTVLLLDVLEHIEYAIEFLTAVRFHLKPAGYLIINVPAMPSLYSRYDAAQGHTGRYTLAELKRELSLAGFEVVAARHWGSNLIPLAVLRKFVVAFMRDEQAMKIGFQPPGKWADRLLRLLMWCELRGVRVPNVGTSLAVLARRRDKATVNKPLSF